jgi:hypothetical protein
VSAPTDNGFLGSVEWMAVVGQALETGMRGLSVELCTRCLDDGDVVPADDDDGFCASCHDTLGEAQDARNAEGV